MKSSKKWLMLAPHLRYPITNGADVAIDGYFRELSKNIEEIHIVSESAHVKMQNEKVIQNIVFKNRSRGKHVASLLSILKHTSFQLEKFITPDYHRFVQKIAKINQFDVVFYSFIATSSLSPLFSNYAVTKHLVYTQNNDFRYYDESFLTSKNLLIRAVARISNRWLYNFISKKASQFIFVNINKDDDEEYRKVFPELHSIILPAGVDFDNGVTVKKVDTSKTILSFVGSLSAKMNIDAILYFEKYFWPQIKKSVKKEIVIQIIGSNPSQTVHNICSKNNWKLLPNVSDEELEKLIQYSSFTILPFEYSNGSKLKLLKSLSLGVPILSTTCAAYMKLPETCLISDDAEYWVNYLNTDADKALTLEARLEIQAFAKSFSWESVITKFRSENPQFF